MSFDKPWLVGNGVAHPVEVARLLAYASTGGAEGVVTPDGLKVRPLATPGTKVRVAPGAALILNRYPGGSQQTYAARLPSQMEVSVTATGSSGGRTDLVVARILDSQYQGQPPSNVQDFDYARVELIEGVPSGTKSTRELNLSYPAVALARITLPANTATVQSSHVTDVREVAQPRKERHLFTLNVPNDAAEEQLYMEAPGQDWPAIATPEGWRVLIPEWATMVSATVMWAGVKIPTANQAGSGQIWLQIGHSGERLVTERTNWGIDGGGAGNNNRQTWATAAYRGVPTAMRGKDWQVRPRGQVNPGGGSARPVLTRASAIIVDIEFHETAV